MDLPDSTGDISMSYDEDEDYLGSTNSDANVTVPLQTQAPYRDLDDSLVE
jgi:hypothetical protein